MKNVRPEDVTKDGMYFVLSNGDKPERIVASAEEAFAINTLYVDIFDVYGFLIESYKFDGEGYTDEF